MSWGKWFTSRSICFSGLHSANFTYSICLNLDKYVVRYKNEGLLEVLIEFHQNLQGSCVDVSDTWAFQDDRSVDWESGLGSGEGLVYLVGGPSMTCRSFSSTPRNSSGLGFSTPSFLLIFVIKILIGSSIVLKPGALAKKKVFSILIYNKKSSHESFDQSLTTSMWNRFLHFVLKQKHISLTVRGLL